MAGLYATPTPSTSTASSPCSDLRTPPPSQHSFMQVPDVFVIPPEEEHNDNPPFCYYDASSEGKQQLSTGPDIEAVDIALGFYQQTDNRAPVFQRSFFNDSHDTIVMPRRNEGRSRDSEMHGRRPEPRGSIVDDSDVVEVVRFKRREVLHGEEEAEGHPFKKSKSFRARASQAFRSIRNLNKAGRSTKASAMSNYGSENMGAVTEDGVRTSTATRSGTPSLVHRKSIQLSQIFAPRNSRPSTSDTPTSPTETAHTSKSSSDWSAISRPSIALEDLENIQPPLPMHPPLSSKKSFRRRISALNLKRVFSSSTETMPMPMPMTMSPTLPPSTSSFSMRTASTSSSWRESLPPARSSSSMLSPVDDVPPSEPMDAHPYHPASAQTPFSLSVAGSLTQGLAPLGADDIDMDENLELRLDSFHFDSLHFDPGEFDLDLDDL